MGCFSASGTLFGCSGSGGRYPWNNNLPTAIYATATPTNGMSLTQLASYMGYTNFEWLQLITYWPTPSYLYAASDPSTPVTAPPTFSDPPPGGYTYSPDLYPFYPFTSPAVCGGNINALCFADQPAAHGLADPSNPPGTAAEFTTQLVGVLPDYLDGSDCLALGTCVNLGLDFDWSDTFNGTSGGITRTANDLPVDPGSGIGGIVIRAVSNGVTVVGSSAIPETSTWAMLLIGFAGLGYAGFRRSSKARLA